MAIEILMPALSPTMTEGTVVKWLKKEGDAVKSGDVIAEIETDKATMEVEAADDGILGRILVPAGTEKVPVNTPIAILLEEGEDPAILAGRTPRPVVAPPAAPPPPAPPVAAPRSASPVAALLPTPASSPPIQVAAVAETGGRVAASPLAKRMAEQADLDLSTLRGSGPGGRIVKSDIEAVLAAGRSGKATAVPALVADAGPPGPAFTEVPNSTMRKVIAARMSESAREAPHFYMTVDCEVDALIQLRDQLNARAGEEGWKLTLNDFVVRAVALGMRRVPAVNATWSEAAVRLYRGIDVSVAVATPTGLITPIVRDADRKGLAEISQEVREKAGRAREGRLLPEEYQGGGFTISNLGMYGIQSFAAIINPPQSCILAVGTAEKRPVVKGNALGIATRMTCTLSVDHRVVDGAAGARFLQAFRQFIEDPLTMML